MVDGKTTQGLNELTDPGCELAPQSFNTFDKVTLIRFFFCFF